MISRIIVKGQLAISLDLIIIIHGTESRCELNVAKVDYQSELLSHGSLVAVALESIHNCDIVFPANLSV